MNNKQSDFKKLKSDNRIPIKSLFFIIPSFTLISWIVGAMLGAVAINFFPDEIKILGQVGWAGTALLGAVICAGGVLIGLIFFIFRRGVKK